MVHAENSLVRLFLLTTQAFNKSMLCLLQAYSLRSATRRAKQLRLPGHRSYNDKPRILRRPRAGHSTGNGIDERWIAYAAGCCPPTSQRVRDFGPWGRCCLAQSPVLSHISWRFRNDEALARSLHLLHSNLFEWGSADICMCGGGRLHGLAGYGVRVIAMSCPFARA